MAAWALKSDTHRPSVKFLDGVFGVYLGFVGQTALVTGDKEAIVANLGGNTASRLDPLIRREKIEYCNTTYVLVTTEAEG
jgi:hypothetical protein